MQLEDGWLSELVDVKLERHRIFKNDTTNDAHVLQVRILVLAQEDISRNIADRISADRNAIDIIIMLQDRVQKIRDKTDSLSTLPFIHICLFQTNNKLFLPDST